MHSHEEGLLPVFVFSTFLVGRSAQFVVSHFPTVVCSSSRREIGYVFLVYFAVGASFSSRTDWLGRSFHVRAVLTVLFGAVVSPRFVGWGAQIRFGSPLIPNVLAGSPCSGTVHSFHCFT